MLVTYHRSLIYKYLGDKIREKQNLCLSAISDIRSAIKDHASLWMLAQLLYENGDMERAYQYMRFSWNATKFYNARLRSWQSADVLSLIDKTYQAMIEKQNDRLQQYLVLITALLVLLIGALGYIYRQMKKLAVARNHLQTANHQLNQLNEELQQMNACLTSTNAELSESNQIKEEYIARFIKLCSTYINRLDAYRRMVNKKVSAGQIAELLKITRSQDALDEELEELYANFDTAFLHLFPDFVKKFKIDGKDVQKGEKEDNPIEIEGTGTVEILESDFIRKDARANDYGFDDNRIVSVKVELADDDAKTYLTIDNTEFKMGTEVAAQSGTEQKMNTVTIGKNQTAGAIINAPTCKVNINILDKWGMTKTASIYVKVNK